MAWYVLTLPPSAPSRLSSPTTFSEDADEFVSWQVTFATEMAGFVAALPAAVLGTGYNATSTTSVAIGTGSKAFTIQTGKNIQVGQYLQIASTASPQNSMYGYVTAYDSGTGALTVTIPSGGTNGSGTFAAWTISVSNPTGAYMLTGGGTLTGALTTATPASGQESLIIPHGAAPSAPTNGSIWTTTSGLFFRQNGATKQVGTLSTAQTWSAAQTFGAGIVLPTGQAIIFDETTDWAMGVSSGNFQVVSGIYPLLVIAGSNGQVSATSFVANAATLGIGYVTGAGGSQTQATNKATGVTSNTVTGKITMNSASLAANTAVSFTLTNSAIAATDQVNVTIVGGATAGAYLAQCDQVSAGSARISLRNLTGGALAEAVVLRFTVFKSADA